MGRHASTTTPPEDQILYVDPRVAHGRARHDLGKDPRMFTENVDRQIVDAIESFSYRYKPQSLPNREVMRLL